MKVLITGGAGYVGSSLVYRLSNQSDVKEVIVYDNLSQKNYALFTNREVNGAKIKFIKANILDNHSLSQALKDIDIVYHLAAKVADPNSDNDSQYFEQVNNWGTANVVREAVKAGIKKFIYLSSVYVYGQGPEKKSVEDTPMPNSFYGISKLRGEEHVKTLPPDINYVIFRSGSVYGANDSTRYDVLINQLQFESHFFKKIFITGEGNQVRPFIHINKLAESLVKVRNSKLPDGTYNLLEHNASVMNIVEQLQELYPDLEFNQVNRHIKMKDVIVIPSEEIKEYIPFTERRFTDELLEFKQQLW